MGNSNSGGAGGGGNTKMIKGPCNIARCDHVRRLFFLLFPFVDIHTKRGTGRERRWLSSPPPLHHVKSKRVEGGKRLPHPPIQYVLSRPFVDEEEGHCGWKQNKREIDEPTARPGSRQQRASTGRHLPYHTRRLGHLTPRRRSFILQGGTRFQFDHVSLFSSGLVPPYPVSKEKEKKTVTSTPGPGNLPKPKPPTAVNGLVLSCRFLLVVMSLYV
ncbi:hypothetical protein LZ30DRAFT_89103 [Colletotrichum cereale]|nr:hypothetical protein LZ30DRAFT_89103 [Colletotrichum cereale]